MRASAKRLSRSGRNLARRLTLKLTQEYFTLSDRQGRRLGERCIGVRMEASIQSVRKTGITASRLTYQQAADDWRQSTQSAEPR